MRKNLWKRMLPWLIGVAAFLTYQAAFRYPEIVEAVYARKIYPALTTVLSYLTKYIPFSLSEVLIYLLIIAGILFLISLIRCFFRPNKLYHILSRFIALGTVASIVFASFVFGWGLNYARKPLAESMELSTLPSEADELISLCETLAAQANTLRTYVKEDAEGVYTLSRPLEELLQDTQALYDDNAADIMNRGGSTRAKAVFTQNALSYFETMGIFSPFTYECHINAEMPALYLPSTIAHEYAHFKGFAREDEANFIAWYTCSQSDDIDFAYSGTMLALNNAMNSLYTTDRDAHARIYQTLDAGILRDWRAYSAYWAPFKTKFAEQTGKAYDNYLKSNGVSDGSKSYGRMLDLILAMQREGRITKNPYFE